MTTIAVIAARMASTRFPGKIMADLAGHPVLGHVVARCRRARHVDDVIVASLEGDTTVHRYLDEVACNRSLNTGLDEGDVLGRVLRAASIAGANVVVRVNGDSPLVDPASIDYLLHEFHAGMYDYGYYHHKDHGPSVLTNHSLPEVLTIDCLRELARMAHLATEHVTWPCHSPYHPTVLAIPFEGELDSNTIDTPEDLERIRYQCRYELASD